nr:immunoglobulin heavy chain junction region [Macaca mulatta]MOY22559.1 immunoglobulin heavy chain junction region [Macaca mulatta]MOY22720.1 immunoglobulin heavy chain junction region [Macaca mulatta]MOY22774.1 immunoglobulin heavy chain junction region [Macaca mulatta]MOY23467.1 immunoglobulin heavy chain junction region [Macaca mulatta]
CARTLVSATATRRGLDSW